MGSCLVRVLSAFLKLSLSLLPEKGSLRFVSPITFFQHPRRDKQLARASSIVQPTALHKFSKDSEAQHCTKYCQLLWQNKALYDNCRKPPDAWAQRKKIKQAMWLLWEPRNTGVLPRTVCSKGNNTLSKQKDLPLLSIQQYCRIVVKLNQSQIFFCSPSLTLRQDWKKAFLYKCLIKMKKF